MGKSVPPGLQDHHDESGRSSVSSQLTGIGASNDGEFGANEWLVEELYEQFKADKNSVDKAWWPVLEAYQPPTGAASAPATAKPAAPAATEPRPVTAPIPVIGSQPVAKTTAKPAAPQPIPAQAPKPTPGQW